MLDPVYTDRLLLLRGATYLSYYRTHPIITTCSQSVSKLFRGPGGPSEHLV